MHQTIIELILEAITGDSYLYPGLYEKPAHFSKRYHGFKKQQYDNAIWN